MIELSGVVADRGPRRVLYGIDLAVRPGEVLALLGPNGAGKSTCLGVAAGDLEPRSGDVRLDGRPLAAMGLRERALSRAVLPQSSSLSFDLTVAEVVQLGRSARSGGAPKRRDVDIVHAALAEVGLSGFAERAYPRLSGGERQRVHFARVLAQVWDAEQGSLLLDEPTSALDLRHQHEVLTRVRGWARRGFAVLVVLHDLGLASVYADRVALLKDGRVFADGAPRDVLVPAAVDAVYGVRTERVELGQGRFCLMPVAAAEGLSGRPSDDPPRAPGTTG